MVHSFAVFSFGDAETFGIDHLSDRTLNARKGRVWTRTGNALSSFDGEAGFTFGALKDIVER